jgi:hypothetical protein
MPGSFGVGLEYGHNGVGLSVGRERAAFLKDCRDAVA